MQVNEEVIIITPSRNAGGTNCATPPISGTSTTPVQTPSSGSTSESSSSVSLSSAVSSKGKCPSIPSHWSSSTQKAIDEKKLDAKVRCDIVRTMVTLLIAKSGPHPKKSEIEQFSRQLVLKYPYMRDDIGTGYVSGYCVTS